MLRKYVFSRLNCHISMHVEYARPWVLVSVGILASDLIVRALKLRILTATLTALGDGAKATTQLSIPSLQSGWNAGSHVWVRRLSGLQSLEVHPFSIAHTSGLSSQGRGLTLYAKSCGDWTRSLNQAAAKDAWTGGQAQQSSCKVVVEGPYGGQMLLSLLDKESIVLIAGGSGVSLDFHTLLVCQLADERNCRSPLCSTSSRP